MRKSRKKWIAGGSVLALIVVVILVAFYCCSSDELHGVVNKQIKALRANNFEEAYNYTSQEFKSATTIDEFRDFVQHYPALNENKSITFGKMTEQNDLASIQATLYASIKNISTQVEYLLVKEDNKWRIMGIQINPLTAGESTDGVVENEKSNVLSKAYNNVDSRYTIKYPASWEYEKSGDGTIIFSGRRGTSAYFSTINIQTVLTKKSGGDFTTVKQFMNDIKLQAKQQSPNVKFIENGAFTLKQKGQVTSAGEYTVFTYKFKGQEFKQYQVVILRDDGQVFYAWAYTAPVAQYDDSIDLAKSMLDTWTIY